MATAANTILTLDKLQRYDTKIKGNFKITKQTNAESGYAATYVFEGTTADDNVKINIPKDFLVKNAEVKTVTTADTPVTGYAVGDKYIDFTVNAVDNSETGTHLYIAVADLVTAYSADDGIEITQANGIKVKLGAGVEINSTTKVIDLIVLDSTSGSTAVGGISKSDYDTFMGAADTFSATAGTATTATVSASNTNGTVTTTPITVSSTDVGGTATADAFHFDVTDTTYTAATGSVAEVGGGAANGGTDAVPAKAGLMSGTDKDNLDALISVFGNDVALASNADIDKLFE